MTSKLGVAFAVILLLIMVTPIFAEVPKPHIPTAKGDQCVEETEFMRRNHMDLLKHKRDLTMRNGIRTKKHSLHSCLDCHAVFDKQQKVVSIKDDRHFCNSCHVYASVSIDCFDCHSSTPIAKDKNSGI